MILLDSDHFSALFDRGDPRMERLDRRLRAADDRDHRLPIVVVEESFRGWLALIKRHRTFRDQLPAYARLAELIDILQDWKIARADVAADLQFERLRSQKIRIGTQDLKIAAIALAHDALLLTANARDFGCVPGLRFDDWLSA